MDVTTAAIPELIMSSMEDSDLTAVRLAVNRELRRRKAGLKGLTPRQQRAMQWYEKNRERILAKRHTPHGLDGQDNLSPP